MTRKGKSKKNTFLLCRTATDFCIEYRDEMGHIFNSVRVFRFSKSLFNNSVLFFAVPKTYQNMT